MKIFQRFVLLSIVTTYLVILAGAIVRGTGSGLGCPDWPRCFGQWIPPTDLSELPENYKEIFKIAGKTIADFDPFKTWTEYVNRLFGVLLGFLLIILFGLSFSVRRYEKSLPWFCGGLLFFVIVQGGIGALVVSTHLKPFLITIHMFFAIVLLFGLLYLRKYCKDLENRGLVLQEDSRANSITRLLVGLTFLQVLMGTQVRQQVDHLTRDTFTTILPKVIEHLDWMFYVHRTFSIVIVALFIYLLIYLERSKTNRGQFFLALLGFWSVLGNVISGITLNYFSFPTGAQPPHLFFGVLTLGFLYTLSLNLRGSLLED